VLALDSGRLRLGLRSAVTNCQTGSWRQPASRLYRSDFLFDLILIVCWISRVPRSWIASSLTLLAMTRLREEQIAAHDPSS
jgi:hypothetical protein